jgi:DNA-binding NtrC family response regulator
MSTSALIVEHTKDDRILLGRIVERCGVEPVLAKCGDAALRLFQRRPLSFVVVLLNMEMVEIDGPGTLYRVRKLHGTVPVWAINGRRPRYSADELCALGAAHILRKPLDERTLSAALMKASLTTWTSATGVSASVAQ